MKPLYLILSLLGLVLPFSQFAPWVYEHGLNIPMLVHQAFANQISAFAWLDVLVSAVVVLIFIFSEGRRIGMNRLWMPVIGLFTVGVSLALPLFLLLREMHLTAINVKT